MDCYKSKNKFTSKVSNILIFYFMILLCNSVVDNRPTLSICQVLAKIIFYRQGVDKRLVDDNISVNSIAQCSLLACLIPNQENDSKNMSVGIIHQMT